jgi:hypothetical protein
LIIIVVIHSVALGIAIQTHLGITFLVRRDERHFGMVAPGANQTLFLVGFRRNLRNWAERIYSLSVLVDTTGRKVITVLSLLTGGYYE